MRQLESVRSEDSCYDSALRFRKDECCTFLGQSHECERGIFDVEDLFAEVIDLWAVWKEWFIVVAENEVEAVGVASAPDDSIDVPESCAAFEGNRAVFKVEPLDGWEID